MTMYYTHKDHQRDFTCAGTASQLFDAWSRAGVIVMSESQFLEGNFSVSDGDTVIVHISFENKKCHEKLASLSGVKVLQSFDESKSDGEVFRTQLEFCKRHGIDTIINGFPSERNISILSSNNIGTITFPFCGLPRDVRYDKKDIDILVSGQIVENYYPIRGKIFRALQEKRLNFAYLPHPGMSGTTATHEFHGTRYFDLLDRCWLGVTCRAGSHRDRLVPKYVEFGFSKVLPVGDCPTYMHSDMRESMITVDVNDSSDELIEKIKDSLDNKARLIERIERYSCRIQEDHNVDKNVSRTIKMLQTGERDS